MLARVRALVTGCAGFIGSTLTDRLLADGHRVLGVDRRDGRSSQPGDGGNLTAAHGNPRFTFVQADLVRADLRPLLAGCDVVFHFAAEPGVRQSWGERFRRYALDNVVVTQRLLDASIDQPERPLIYASSSSVYGERAPAPTQEGTALQPSSPYSVSKLAGEQLCSAYADGFGVMSRILRLFTVYGPRQRHDMALMRLARSALCGEAVTVYGDGAQRRDFTYVQDVVDVALAAAAANVPPARVYNVGTGRSTSLLEAIELVAELSGRNVTASRGPARAGEVRETCADPTRAREELGIVPTTPLRDGLAAQLASVAASPGPSVVLVVAGPSPVGSTRRGV